VGRTGHSKKKNQQSERKERSGFHRKSQSSVEKALQLPTNVNILIHMCEAAVMNGCL